VSGTKYLFQFYVYPIRQFWFSFMYLRFVVGDIDEDSKQELGVFHAIRNLREQGRLSEYEEEQDDVIGKW
jgi:hypothetical protein